VNKSLIEIKNERLLSEDLGVRIVSRWWQIDLLLSKVLLPIDELNFLKVAEGVKSLSLVLQMHISGCLRWEGFFNFFRFKNDYIFLILCPIA